MSPQPKKDTIKMGERIRQERERLGLSQQQLLDGMRELAAQATPDDPYYGASTWADASGLSNVELGKNGVPRPRLKLLAAALEVTPESLYVEKSTITESQYLQDLPYVDLEHIPVPARASFAAMCGAQSDYDSADTLRLYLPPGADRIQYGHKKVITSSGDLMNGVLHDGDRVIISLVPEAK